MLIEPTNIWLMESHQEWVQDIQHSQELSNSNNQLAMEVMEELAVMEVKE